MRTAPGSKKSFTPRSGDVVSDDDETDFVVSPDYRLGEEFRLSKSRTTGMGKGPIFPWTISPGTRSSGQNPPGQDPLFNHLNFKVCEISRQTLKGV